MRRSKLVMTLLGSLAFVPAAEAADVQCTTADTSTWLPLTEIKVMLAQHGFTNIGAIKPNARNCYIVQATDNKGAKRTLYLDPTDGALMAVE